MNEFETQECRAELDRLAERRRAAFDELDAVSDELETWIHRSREARVPKGEIARRLGISRQRVHVYLQPGRRPKSKRSAE